MRQDEPVTRYASIRPVTTRVSGNDRRASHKKKGPALQRGPFRREVLSPRRLAATCDRRRPSPHRAKPASATLPGSGTTSTSRCRSEVLLGDERHGTRLARRDQRVVDHDLDLRRGAAGRQANWAPTSRSNPSDHGRTMTVSAASESPNDPFTGTKLIGATGNVVDLRDRGPHDGASEHLRRRRADARPACSRQPRTTRWRQCPSCPCP